MTQRNKWFLALGAKYLLVILLLILYTVVVCRAQLASDLKRWEEEKQELATLYAAELSAKASEAENIKRQAEAGIYATQYLSSRYEGDAWTLGQWLDCLDAIYPGLTSEAKTLACWVVINRMESADYPDDIESVLLQPGQFNEFSGDTPPTEGNVAIASNQLSRYYNGDIRPAPAGAVYITISSEGVVLRDTWEETAQTGHWRA